MGDWLDVTRITSNHNGGSMVGGPPRMVWHTFEAPASLSAAEGARRLIADGHEVHFVLHPAGGLVQILPASVAGRGLKNVTGGVQTNREGSVCIQVEVIAYAADPFTRHLTTQGLADLHRLVGFARAHGVADVWPNGAPPVAGHDGLRSADTWISRSGHYGHSQVPENDHTDPGAIDAGLVISLPDPRPPVPPSDDWTQKIVNNLPTLKRGVTGHAAHVGRLQGILRYALSRPGLVQDGDFGPATEDAVQQYQGAYHLSADGVVGPQTWAKLLLP